MQVANILFAYPFCGSHFKLLHSSATHSFTDKTAKKVYSTFETFKDWHFKFSISYLWIVYRLRINGNYSI